MVFIKRFLLIIACFSLAGVADDKAKAAPEGKYKAMLIWGTEGSKPDDPNLRDLDENFKNKLRKIFKWHNYYEVKSQPFSIAPGAPKKRLKLSDKCEVDIEHSPTEGMIIELWGEGKSVKTVKQAMPLTDWIVVGGDDKNATAWFVIIKPE